MIRKAFCEGFAAGLLGLGAISLSGAAELRGIHLSTSADSAQVTLDLTEGATHRLFTLEHPDRVVMDLSQTHLASEVRAPAASGVVTDVRFGNQPDGTLRVVGHGGEDPGAIGHGGTREKDVTLAIARALAERINAEAGMHAVLTRDRDELLDLRDRIGRAHAARADLFISVHADSIRDRSVSGASVYVLSVHGASSEAARWLAERENSADLVGGARGDDPGPLEPGLIDAAQNET